MAVSDVPLGGNAELDAERTRPPPRRCSLKHVPQKIDRGAPDVGARLKWIYGYAGRGCRNNVRYAAGGEVGGLRPSCCRSDAPVGRHRRRSAKRGGWAVLRV